MTIFHTLASGSSGNAALISCGDTHLLVDMGISCRRVARAMAELGIPIQTLRGILITHEHADHINGLATYSKLGTAPIYCTPGTARQLSYRLTEIIPLLHPSAMGKTFSVGSLQVTTFPTCHDCSEGAAYRVRTPDGTIGYLTDTGFILDETYRGLLGADLLVLESNHDVERLRSGPYPYSLKMRILGPMGHLSNMDTAAFAVESAKRGTRTIILAHLSRENNSPELALGTVGQALEVNHCHVHLAVAPRSTTSECYTLGEKLSCVGCV